MGIIRKNAEVVRYVILKRMIKIDFLTFKVWDYVFSFKPEHVRETVHMSGLHTIVDDAAALEKTGE
jgi:hypothetical protein